MNKNVSYSLDENVIKNIKCGADARKMSLSAFLSECVESYLSRNPILNGIVHDVSSATGLPEWRVVEQQAIIKVARDRAQIDVFGYLVDVVPAGSFETIEAHYRRQFEAQYIQEILQREVAGIEPDAKQRELLKKYRVGADYQAEKFMRETVARGKLLQLVKTEKLTTAEYDKIPLSMFADVLSKCDNPDMDTVLNIAKDLLKNDHIKNLK